MKKNIVSCLLLFCSVFMFAQNENAKWYFGDYAGLDFMTSPPTALVNSASSSTRGCATVSDATGNLLFYTDGLTVYNQLHAVMANGTGLGIGSTGEQPALIVKQPGNSAIYFIFTNNTNGLRCSTIDMTLAAGMGSVTIKNVILLNSTRAGQMTSTLHCNGTDVWVLSHDYNNTNFRAHLVSNVGINPTPVTSSIGVLQSATSSYMKISRNGRKLANQYNSGSLTLFDFDPATGVVSNPVSLVSSPPEVYRAIEFSPDGSKLYCTLDNGAPFSQLAQWDLCAGSPGAIIASQYTMTTSHTTMGLQLAQDGKIYVARVNQNSIGVIHNPNALGAACSYVNAGQSIAPAVSSNALPPWSYHPWVSPTFSYTSHCQNVQFVNSAAVTGTSSSCEAPRFLPVSHSWNFGDPLSGANNTTTVQNPTHLFSSLGTYTSMLIINYPCFTDTLKQAITISALSPTLNVTGNFSICAGIPATLAVSGASSYSWSHGATSSLVVLSPSITTTYSIIGYDLSNCYPAYTTVTISVVNSSLAVTNPSSICIGQTATLSGTGADTYSWSNGPNTNTIIVSPIVSTNYFLSGTDANGCARTVTASVNVYPLTTLSVTGGGTACLGTPVLLSASGAATYTWNTGVSSGTLNVQPETTTVYSVSGTDINGCIGSSTVLLTTHSSPSLSVAGNFSLCIGETLTLTALGAFTYTWNTGDQTATIHPEPSSDTVYSVTGADIYGCLTHTSVFVFAESAQVLALSPDIKVKPGFSTTLTVRGGSDYLWSPETGMSCSDCSDPVVTPLQTTRYCVTSRSNFCKTSRCVNVEVSCNTGDYQIPNAFTPNGDGNNDEFCLQGWSFCVTKFTVMIFNRWGEKMYESSDASFCWDGSFKGKALDADVYIFMIVANFGDGIQTQKKGNITLLR